MLSEGGGSGGDEGSCEDGALGEDEDCPAFMELSVNPAKETELGWCEGWVEGVGFCRDTNSVGASLISVGI